MPQPETTVKTFVFHKASMDTPCGFMIAKPAGKDENFVSSMDPEGVEAACGLEVGDVLFSINGMRVTSFEQLGMLLKSVEGQVTLVVTRLLAPQTGETSTKPAALNALLDTAGVSAPGRGEIAEPATCLLMPSP